MATRVNPTDPGQAAPIVFGELKSQFRAIESEIRAAIDDVLESAWYIFGKHCAAFEQEFAAYVGARHAVGVGSGTEAIHLALLAVGVRPGDEVITVANTCVPTVAGIAATGARPVLVDADPVTLTLDPVKLEAAITPRTRAIVPVHLYGHPCDMDPILEVAAGRGVPVVEDCAQAHGTAYRGKRGPHVRCGTFGAAAAFSFYPSKNLGAYGDAGAVTTNDPALDAALRMLRNYGEEKRYHHTCKGFNSRLDEIQAAILRVKLRHLDAWNEARRDRAAVYAREIQGQTPHFPVVQETTRQHLGNVGSVPVFPPVVLPAEAPWARHIYHLYVIRSPHRDALQAFLKDRGIATLLHYPVPIHMQKAYADLGYTRGSFPETEKACDEVLSLPMYAELPIQSIERVAHAIRDFHV